jgi:hypothetical protein
LSVRAFCRREQLRETAFYFWRREIRRRDAERQARPSTARAATFVELVPAPAPATGAGSTATIELLLPGDRRVLIRGGFDASLLRQVLVVLDSVGLSNGEGQSC